MKLTSICCGCSACVSVCPRSALTMEQNRQGFYVPRLDASLCIDCGLCQKVCPTTRTPDIARNLPIAFALRRKDSYAREKSQSGGAFALLAEQALRQKSIVYGVGFDTDLHVKYLRIERKSELYRLQRSKYVQADIGNTYLQIRADLSSGKSVLFSGTPCHVDGLLRYLKQVGANTENLMTVDLICHGTPSPRHYREYLHAVSAQVGQPVTRFIFRDRTVRDTEIFYFGKKRKTSRCWTDLFYTHNSLAASCYDCRFTNLDRPGDLTVGDAWGIEKTNPSLNPGEGISLVLLNTEKGRAAFQQIFQKAILYPMSLENGECIQPTMQHPYSKPETYDDFWADYFAEGFEYTLKKYTGHSCDELFDLPPEPSLPRALARRVKGKIKHILGK